MPIRENILGIDTAPRDAEKLPVPSAITGSAARGAGTITSSTSNDATIANHTHALDTIVGLTPATYGSASNVAQITVDAKGRITAAANVAIAGTIGGSIAATQVAYGSGVNTIQGSANLTYSAPTLTMSTNAVGNRALVIKQYSAAHSGNLIDIRDSADSYNIFSVSGQGAISADVNVSAVTGYGARAYVSLTANVRGVACYAGTLAHLTSLDINQTLQNAPSIFYGLGNINPNVGKTVAEAQGLKVYLTKSGAGTLTTWKGVSIETPLLVAGAFTNNYGIFLNDQTGATNNWSIYGGAGLYRFGDQLAIAGSADRQQLIVTGHTMQATSTAMAQFTRNDAAAGVSAVLGLTGLGSGASGDGGSIIMAGKSSTTAAQPMSYLEWLWVDATHASRTSRLDVYNVVGGVKTLQASIGAGGVTGNTIFHPFLLGGM